MWAMCSRMLVSVIARRRRESIIGITIRSRTILLFAGSLRGRLFLLLLPDYATPVSPSCIAEIGNCGCSIPVRSTATQRQTTSGYVNHQRSATHPTQSYCADHISLNFTTLNVFLYATNLIWCFYRYFLLN